MSERAYTPERIIEELQRIEREQKKKTQNRAKARRLAKRILRMKDQIKDAQKELYAIYYDYGPNYAFSHSERINDEIKNGPIHKALRVEIEER